jgi:hypothetical protein
VTIAGMPRNPLIKRIEAMTTHSDAPPANPEIVSAPEEEGALCALRARYRESRDLFSTREMARLRFLRWLVHTGRLTP